MSHIVIRTVFNTTFVERSWKTKATSAIVHAIVIGTAFVVAVPVVEKFQTPPTEHITLIAPVPPRPHVTIPLPHIRVVPKLVAPIFPLEKPPEKPVVVIAKVIPPPVISTPKIAIVPTVPAPLPTILPKVQPILEADARPVLPKPSTKVGALEDLQAKSAPVPKQVVVGGFGDPRGVHPSDSRSDPVILARVGAFDSPTGLGKSGGGGHLDAGSIRQSGFGTASATGVPSANGTANNVRTGNFGDTSNGSAHSGSGGAIHASGFGDSLDAAPQHKSPAVNVAAFTPVEILSKPRPSYSAEARGLHLEGQVSLEVVFQANGAVKVVRIIKGLGHGLDEAAQQAALQVRFKPATRAGAPVDTNATINITFQLT